MFEYNEAYMLGAAAANVIFQKPLDFFFLSFLTLDLSILFSIVWAFI